MITLVVPANSVLETGIALVSTTKDTTGTCIYVYEIIILLFIVPYFTCVCTYSWK